MASSAAHSHSKQELIDALAEAFRASEASATQTQAKLTFAERSKMAAETAI